MALPPELLELIQRAKAAGLQIDENDPEQVMRFMQMLQASSMEPPETQERIPDPVISSFDVKGIAEYIKQGKARNIIVMVGAGLSTAAGIPDFRTPGTGLYDNLQKYDLPRPEAIFSLDYFRQRPGAFYELAREMWPGNYAPTKAHYFIKLLEEKSLLLRCFTQNIDSLEELAGVSPQKIMAAHGNFSSAHGLDTGEEVPTEEVKAAVMRGEEGWKEMTERRKTLVKPDIVFFGESLPERFGQLVQTDFPRCDLLIVMGTSLVVAPFCNCVTFVEDHCPRLLVNREHAGLDASRGGRFGQGRMRGGFRLGEEFQDRNWRDAFFQGDCDEGVEALCEELGWSQDLERVVAEGLRATKGEIVEESPVAAAAAAPRGGWLSGALAWVTRLCAPQRAVGAADLEEMTEYSSKFEGRKGLLTLTKNTDVQNPACSGEIAYTDEGLADLQEEIERVVAGAKAKGVALEDVFLSSPSPGTLANFFEDDYFKDHTKYLEALGKAMKREYDAIYASGLTLQVDCPDLGMGRHTKFKDSSLEEFLAASGAAVRILNEALADIPADRIRMHVCWGNYPGPHHHDVPLADIIDLVLTAKPKYLSVEACNPGHGHEWEVFETTKLPEGKVIMPGVLDTTTSHIEHPRLIAQRLMNYIRLVGPEQVMACTDCGFSTAAGAMNVPTEIVYAKLQSMVKGAKIASEMAEALLAKTS